MKILRNILFILSFTMVLFSCEKEVIKPVESSTVTERAVIIGYDDDGSPIYREVTDPDEDEDFEGTAN
ncbi:MAG: hypothetical protein ACWA41_02385 [Putridiphycobacter sp.]